MLPDSEGVRVLPYWATEAAIRVLARLGREEETLAHDILEAFRRLADDRPSQGCWSGELTFHRSWLALSLLFPHEREDLERKLRELEAPDPDEDD